MAADRRHFIGGSDARVIMGDDEARLIRLWREKRGELEPEDLGDNLIVQLGTVTEELNRRWYERNTGHAVKRRAEADRAPRDQMDGGDAGRHGRGHRARCSKPSSCCPGRSRKKPRPKSTWRSCSTTCGSPMPGRRRCRSSPAAANGSRLTIHADPLYQHLLLTAEKKFWRCVESGEAPRLFGVEPPRPRLEAVRIVDMSASNSLGGTGRELTAGPARPIQEHERAKAELKKLVPEDAREAIGHGLRAKRSKSGAISFDLLEHGGRPCSAPVRPSAPLPRRWPRPRANSPIRKNR